MTGLMGFDRRVIGRWALTTAAALTML